MALPWALAVLSLLPLLEAQRLACTDIAAPITKASLDQMFGKWYLIATAYRHPAFKELASTIKAAFFYLTPNNTEDTIQFREYATIGDQCFYASALLTLRRENGTVLHYNENGVSIFGYLMLPKDRRTFMLATLPEDPENIGISFYATRPKATQRQLRQFYKDLRCRGLKRSDVRKTDDREDLCKPLEKQHQEEREKEN